MATTDTVPECNLRAARRLATMKTAAESRTRSTVGPLAAWSARPSRHVVQHAADDRVAREKCFNPLKDNGHGHEAREDTLEA